ncbi:MAG: DMT family transporter [Actinomycetota bacterium]
MRSSTEAGLGLALLSAATFGTSGSFAAALLDVGWTPGAAVTARVTIAALVLTVPALLQLRGRGRALVRSGRTVLGYGVFAVAGAQLCFFNAVAHVSVGVALLLEYSGTLLVVLWVWLRQGHRPGRLTGTGAALALLGLVLVLDLLGDHRLDPVGVAWGLGAAVGLAVFFVLSADADAALPPLATAWTGLVVGGAVLSAACAVGALPARAPRVDVTLAGARTSWLVPVLALALIAAALAYVSGILAARMLGARLSSFVGLTEVLFAVGFAWVLLGQVPRPVQLVGGALVVAGVSLVRLDEGSSDAGPLAGGSSPAVAGRRWSQRGSAIRACRRAPRSACSAGDPTWAPRRTFRRWSS